MRIVDTKLKDIMTTDPVTARIDETVSDAMAKIKKHKVRELPVLDGSRPVGLVSYSSFIERRSVPITAKLDSIMLQAPRLDEDSDIIDAAEALVAAGIRGAPVMRGSAMVGFVSRTDVIRVMAEADELRAKRVEEFMTRDPKVVKEDDYVRKAQILMEDLNEKALPVVDGSNRLVGVVGMSEILDVIWRPRADAPRRSPKPPRKVFDDRAPARIAIGSVMTRNAVTVAPGESLEKTVGLMLDRGLSTLFVVDDGKLVGVVDQSDLMEQLINLRPRDQVFVQISGLGMQEPDVYDGLYDLIGRGMKRIDKMERPRVFYLHIAAYDQAGMTSKYSLRARLNTEKNMYYVRHADWDLYKAASTLLESLETKVRREREKKLDEKKRRPSSVPGPRR
jgi:CBS domain-containing protein